jgi:hypothetical protein
VCRAAPEQTLDNGNLSGLRLRGNVLHHLVRIPSPVACPPPHTTLGQNPRDTAVSKRCSRGCVGEMRPDLGNPRLVLHHHGPNPNLAQPPPPVPRQLAPILSTPQCPGLEPEAAGRARGRCRAVGESPSGACHLLVPLCLSPAGERTLRQWHTKHTARCSGKG